MNRKKILIGGAAAVLILCVVTGIFIARSVKQSRIKQHCGQFQRAFQAGELEAAKAELAALRKLAPEVVAPAAEGFGGIVRGKLRECIAQENWRAAADYLAGLETLLPDAEIRNLSEQLEKRRQQQLAFASVAYINAVKARNFTAAEAAGAALEKADPNHPLVKTYQILRDFNALVKRGDLAAARKLCQEAAGSAPKSFILALQTQLEPQPRADAVKNRAATTGKDGKKSTVRSRRTAPKRAQQ